MKVKPRYTTIEISEKEYVEFLSQLTLFIDNFREYISDIMLKESYYEKVFDGDFKHKVEFRDGAIYFILE